MAKKKDNHWMEKAFGNPKTKGKLHQQLGVPTDEPIPAKKLAKAAGKGGKLGMRARAAVNARKATKKK